MPFAVIFMELYFIFKSMWQDQYYYMFGFLAFVFGLLVITCIEITIVMIYFQLCNEDYRWQWKSGWASS
jgi:transmembrane 9 superfamily protein 2/4